MAKDRRCHRCDGDGSRTEVRWPKSWRWYPLCEACWVQWWMLGRVYASLGLVYA